MKQGLLAAIAIFAVMVATQTQAGTENCAPKSTGVKVLKSPHPNDVDPDWSGQNSLGLSWSLSVNGTVANNGLDYKSGHLITPRGGVQKSQVYVIADEWECNSLDIGAVSSSAQNDIGHGKLAYRGFTVDVSAIQNISNFAEIERSVKHQLDIVADCGAKPEVLDFFRNQEITLKPGAGDGGGNFNANSTRVTVDAAVQPPQKPIILHELLHAYHYRILPGSFQNPDVLRFYNNAKQGQRYPVVNPGDDYVLKNAQEFFAVTASLYLWGNVDRQPHTRENLKASQPYYYAWLANLFGIQK